MSHARKFTQLVLSTIIILSMSLSASQSQSASAQGGDGIKRQVNAESGKVSFIGPESGRPVAASLALGSLARPADPAMALAKRFAPEFGLKNPERDLSVKKAGEPQNGRITVRYQQNYEGIPVMGGELIVNTNENGDLYSMNGEVSPNLTLSTQPTVDSEQAKQTALESAAKWYQKTPADFVVTEPELWIFDESLLNSSTRPVELVWRMEVTSADNSLPLRELILINAQRGSISLHFNQVDTAWASPVSIGTNDMAQDTTPTEPPAETPIPTETPIPLETSTPSPTESLTPTEVTSSKSSSDEVGGLAGVTWYVATTGNNSNSCSVVGSPCLTINGAIGKASNGDIIKVAIGTYTGTGIEEVVQINKNINLSGGWNVSFTNQSGNSTIDGQGSRQGIVIWSGTTTVIEHFTIQNGLATFTASGGGIFNEGFLTLNHSLIRNNRASGGGGIYASSSSNTTINNSAIYFNTAISTYGGGNGGGISGGYYQSLQINNSTISNNTAENGGGIYKNTSSNLINLNNVTISENHAKRDGGGIYSGSSATVVLKNTILANNTSLFGGANCNISSLVLDGHSILYPQICSYSGGSPTNVNPQLGTFIPSAGYYPLLLGSPAINAGSLATCAARDQRGVARPVGAGCDIGAYEYTAPGPAASLSILDGNTQRTPPFFTFPKPLKVVALDNQGSPVPAVNITFTAPGSGASVKFVNTNTNTMSALTDASGGATTSTFAANNEIGIYTISASASGVGPTNFNLENGGWYVAPSGNDANNCFTPASACATINGAINKPTILPGDIISVAEGTYYGSGFEVVTLNKNVTLAGGWNQSFTSRTGFSIIDGQATRRGIKVFTDISATMDHFMVRNGYAGEYVDGTGGGIWNDGNLTINSSSIHNNMAFAIGGGIMNLGTIGLNNTTISNNLASDQGGGIFNSVATINLNNVTISGNQATAFSSRGGGIYNYGGISIKNSILADNTDSSQSPNCYNNNTSNNNGTITSLGYNIVGNTAGCAVTATAGDKFNVNPKLAVFLPAQGYQPLQFGSPAINAGNSQTCYGLTDQRGVSRVGICDIGAYEYTAAGIATNLVILDGNNQRTPPTFNFSKVLKAVALDNQGSPVQGIHITFTAPSNGPRAIFTSTNANTASIITDPSGVAATSTLVANNLFGTYVISASASGVSSVNFSLENGARYVMPSGNDANSCASPASPCSTISGAINKASDGDTILIALGTYDGTSGIAILKDLTLLGGWDNGFTTQIGQSTIQGMFGVGGGGDYYQRTNVVLENLTVSSSIASGGVTNSGTLTFRNGSVINNSLGFDNYGDLTIVNSTISGNGTSVGGQGAITNHNPGGSGIENSRAVVKIINSTIANNIGNLTGGIFNGDSRAGLVILKNSIVAGNRATPGYGPDCFGGNYDGKFISLGGNIIGNVGPFIAGSGYRCKADWLGTDLVGDAGNPVNANFDTLTNLGNNTWLHPIKLGSPAINAVILNNCPLTDQRGISRPQDFYCDIGAFEYEFDYDPDNLLLTTYNAGNSTSLPGALVCDQTDLNCITGDAHAKAAHKYAAGIYNLYKSSYNRNSIDGSGIEIISSVHYGSNYKNAFWNGHMMIYGDGYGFPLADDLVAHELTHGVTQYESNLYPYYQSGAINESFSDLWGEYYDQTNSQGNDAPGVKWLLGEDTSGLGAIRNMSNPSAFNDPDKMSSINYYEGQADSGGVHTNSGLNNKAVFLMVDGGSFNGKTVTALGWTKTSAIYYEVNTNLLSSGADYSDLYYALQQACSSLIGQNGITAADCLEVKDAVDAVEMNAQPAANFNPDAPFCGANLIPITKFADDLESGATNWSFTNGSFTRWQYDSPYGYYSRSGEHFLYADDYPGAITNASARLTSVVVPVNAYLHFSHAYDFETGNLINDPTLYNFDGGVLEYSINNGSTWADAGSLIDFNGYDGIIFTGAGNPLSGRSAFAGSSHGYISTRLNLASLAGRTVTFRWRMGLDSEVAALGWWLDNVKVYECLPKANVSVTVGNSNLGNYVLQPYTGLRQSYAGVDNGPVKVVSTNGTKIVASERVAYSPDGGTTWTSHSELMGLPLSQLTNSYTFPWYNNLDLNSQLRFGNVGTANTNVTVTIGGIVQGTYPLAPNASQRISYAGLDAGPVKITSSGNVPIIASMRVAYSPDGGTIWTSFSEMMGLPSGQLTNSYIFPWYNNLDLNSQLRFGNVGTATTTVTVTVGGVFKGAYTLIPNESKRVSYAGLDAGPVRVTSSGNVSIIASMRVAYNDGSDWTDFSEMMGMPSSSLSTHYSFPAYNNVNLNTQLRFGNVGNASTTVKVTINGVLKGTYNLAPNASQRISYAGVNSGPVVIQSSGNVPIIASMRVAYFDGSDWTSFAEMMGLPQSKLTTTYLFPWYNNIDLDTQLRFGVP